METIGQERGMKFKSQLFHALTFCGLVAASSPALAQGTVFTYQGRLLDGLGQEIKLLSI